MTRETPPFRADHVGSLLRPAALLEARARHAAGTIDADELRTAEDAAVRRVVRMQEDVGLQTATDGEFRRTSWHMDFIYQLGGVARTDEKLTVHFRNDQGELDFESAALKVQEFIAVLKDLVAIPIKTWDERLTSAQAQRFLIQGGVRRAERKEKVDKMAASILLQSYLDSLAQ